MTRIFKFGSMQYQWLADYLKKPGYVFPALRRYLIQLLTYLAQSCERLILPYIAPIHKALLAKLCEGTAGVNANNGIISGVLVTVGDLARGGFSTREYIPELMPRIVEALLDRAVATKHEVAVAILGQVVQSTGLRAAVVAVKREDDRRLFHNAAMRKQRREVSDRWVNGDGNSENGSPRCLYGFSWVVLDVIVMIYSLVRRIKVIHNVVYLFQIPHSLDGEKGNFVFYN
ncbi:unnamed protein product [Lactuca saligna]|uniref:Serine/threonine-protein kinase TOR n=1 Tax=Lactuca saligna TaxID=75948 RepID=A0AA35YW83_LACSI|nr:unnamed protein product [Lactuca saligna]